MRSPLQILAIPYRKGKEIQYCVFRRSDSAEWQFIAGGGEDNETPTEAAVREICEETGIAISDIMQLTSMTYLPVNIIQKDCRQHWANDIYVIPEYHFAFECTNGITISNEHTAYVWVNYEEALRILTWESNKTVLYELNCRLLAEK